MSEVWRSQRSSLLAISGVAASARPDFLSNSFVASSCNKQQQQPRRTESNSQFITHSLTHSLTHSFKMTALVLSLVLAVAVAVAVVVVRVRAEAPQREVAALHHIYTSTRGEQWQWQWPTHNLTHSLNHSTWNFTQDSNGNYLDDPCSSQWLGVSCSSDALTCSQQEQEQEIKLLLVLL